MERFIDLNGRVVCLDHAGAYLQSSVQQMPERESYNTPITNWLRVPNDALHAELTCETCDRA